MIDFCILGSGMAGSTIARLLSKKYSVKVFDKARGPGGRSSNKRYKNNLNFDHGTQYFSPKTRNFNNFIRRLHKKKILKIWEGKHIDFTFKNKTNHLKYIGVKANNDICKFQLKNIKQHYTSKISKLEFKNKFWQVSLENKSKYRFRVLILTAPYPQTKKLVKKYLDKKFLNLNVKMQPNITALLAFKNIGKIPFSSIKFNDKILSWVSNENSKNRFKSNINLLTLQSTKNWAKKKINSKNKKKVLQQIITKFIGLTGFEKKKIIFKKIHVWKYSYNFNNTPLKNYWSKKYNMGVCADWFNGPKIEDAWESAYDLYEKIKKNPL